MCVVDIEGFHDYNARSLMFGNILLGCSTIRNPINYYELKSVMKVLLHVTFINKLTVFRFAFAVTMRFLTSTLATTALA